MTRSLWLPVTRVAAVALLALAFLAPAAVSSADDGEVTFRNQTAKTQHLLVRAGDGQCSDRTDKTQLEIEPGESAQVAADSKLCWCYSSFGKIGDCTDYRMAKPGSTQKIR